MGKLVHVPEGRLKELLDRLPGRVKASNLRSGESRIWAALEGANSEDVLAGLRGPRPFFSFKGALMPACELVARYGQAEQDPLEEAAGLTVALIGLRGCECRALAYLDAIMLSDPMPDSFYKVRRGNTFVVAVDCAEAAQSCFCNLLGEVPYAERNYDLNLTPMEGGFLVETGSEEGERALAEAAAWAQEATDQQRAERERVRQRTKDQLARQNAQFSFPQTVAQSLPTTVDDAFWRGELARCVQCGGCTAVCPQCYCFLLYDQPAGPGSYDRGRVWDSCQFTGYSQMAAPPGTPKPDPRREHMSKFQHRFFHKFWYNPLTLGMLGCVGCGRCAETCPGAIDLRRVLSAVSREHARHG